MRAFQLICLISLALFCAAPAFAACTGPAGEAGEIIYNADHKVVQYCKGTVWKAVGKFGSGSGGCSSPSEIEGTIIFDKDNAVMKYCGGSQWVPLGLGPFPDTTTALKGWWKFDESSGATASDSSAFGNNATLVNGPLWQPSGGALAGALLFDGTDDYAQIASATDDLYPSSNAFTISTWIYMDTFNGGNQHIMEAYNDTGTNFLYQFFVDSSGSLQFTIHSGGDTYHVTDTPMIPRQWYHVAVTFDGAANWVEIYINGMKQNLLPGYAHLESGDYSATPDIGPVRIGHVDTLDYFPGKIDDLRFYSRALAAADIAALYNAGSNSLQAQTDTTTGLMARWKLDETAGTSATDSAGGYTGTLTNFPASPWLNPAKLDGGLTFDGTNDYVNMGDIDAFDGMSAMTVSAWVKTTSNAEQHIISKGECTGTVGAGSWEFGIADPASNLNSTFFALYDPASGGSVASCSGGTYPENINVHDGQWHHVAGTWDGSTGIAYIDGIPCASTIPFTSMDSTTDSVEMGGQCNGVNPNRLNGTIDDVRIYNRALSGADIAALAKYEFPDCTDPQGYTAELLYNLDADLMQYCNGTVWIPLSGGAQPPPEPRRVFVTSTTYNGNLGGVQGSNDKCQARAAAAGLAGTYLAWISTGAGDQPSSTFTQSTTGYIQVEGTKVADSWADLTDGDLDTAINVNEFGQNTAATNVWTNVASSGATKASASTCLNWTDGTAGNSGHRGSNTSATATWTDAGTTACNNARRLYCFQQ